MKKNETNHQCDFKMILLILCILMVGFLSFIKNGEYFQFIFLIPLGINLIYTQNKKSKVLSFLLIIFLIIYIATSLIKLKNFL